MFNVTIGGEPSGPKERSNNRAGKYIEIWKKLAAIPVDASTGVGMQWLAVRGLTKEEAYKIKPSFSGGSNSSKFYKNSYLFSTETRIRVSEVPGDPTYVLWIRRVPLSDKEKQASLLDYLKAPSDKK